MFFKKFSELKKQIRWARLKTNWRIKLTGEESICEINIYIVQIVYLSFEFKCEKNESTQKEAGIGHFKKTFCY